MKIAGLVLLLSIACSKSKDKVPPPPPPPPAVTAPTDTALAAYEAKQWAKCAEMYSKMERADALYNAACCLALDGKRDQAFAMLDRVLDKGFRDVEHMKQDTDLASLHDDPRWAKLLATAEATVAKFEAALEEPALRKELMALRDEDQAARQAWIANRDDKVAQKRVEASDKHTTTRMKEIIAKYGWPGKSLVGEDGANSAWLFVQHADQDPAFQKECLGLLEKAYKAGEAREIDYAYLYDRVAVAEKRPQRYGTQFKDGEPQPIEDAAHVDERRKAIGLGTMAEYKKDMERMYGSGKK
jgi:hypothetical protein